jgi:hypothetical protein
MLTMRHQIQHRNRENAHQWPMCGVLLIMRRHVACRMRIRCQNCNCEMTWSEQKRQFGRMLRKGLSIEDAGRLSPRCSKCVTQFFRPNEALIQAQILAEIASRSHGAMT